MANSIRKPVPTETIVIEDAKLVKFLEDKDELVTEGRKLSKEIDAVQKEIDECIKEEIALTEKVEPKELIDKGNKLRDEVNKLVEELQKVADDIKDEKKKAIPKELEEKHLKLNDKREKLEIKRNKIALKVQKIKDRFIPKLHKHVKPMLKEYEDISTADVKDGKVIVEKFNHVEEYKRQYQEQNAPKKEDSK